MGNLTRSSTDDASDVFVPRSVIIRQHTTARNRLWNAVKCGKVVRLTECEVCGSGDHIEAHHVDYSRPLDVVWLCRSCHVAHH